MSNRAQISTSGKSGTLKGGLKAHSEHRYDLYRGEVQGNEIVYLQGHKWNGKTGKKSRGTPNAVFHSVKEAKIAAGGHEDKYGHVSGAKYNVKKTTFITMTPKTQKQLDAEQRGAARLAPYKKAPVAPTAPNFSAPKYYKKQVAYGGPGGAYYGPPGGGGGLTLAGRG